jgi:hypothetical protein
VVFDFHIRNMVALKDRVSVVQVDSKFTDGPSALGGVA